MTNRGDWSSDRHLCASQPRSDDRPAEILEIRCGNPVDVAPCSPRNGNGQLYSPTHLRQCGSDAVGDRTALGWMRVYSDFDLVQRLWDTLEGRRKQAIETKNNNLQGNLWEFKARPQVDGTH